MQISILPALCHLQVPFCVCLLLDNDYNVSSSHCTQSQYGAALLKTFVLNFTT